MGFLVVDRLAQAHQVSLSRRKFKAVFGVGRMGPLPVILAKPAAFMNQGGPAVRDLARFFSLGTQDVVVIHDDIDLVFGKIKIKQKGGDGGHNGVRSLIEALGSSAFTRLRIGIGRPPTQQQTRDYVLGRFDAEQETLLEDVISRAQDAVETIFSKGIAEAMNRFHGDTIFRK
jgi:PTH1 family peptidyl-tRNA hydrolase